MKDFVIPKVIKKGDTIALISLSGGRAGDEDMLCRYQTRKLSDEEEQMWLKFLKYEAKRDDIPVLTNVDFVHRTPMTVLPMGALAEIDCKNVTFRILESGVVE